MTTEPRFSPSQLGSLEKCPQYRSAPIDTEVSQEGRLLHAAIATRSLANIQEPEQRAAVERCLEFLVEWEQEFSGFTQTHEQLLSIPPLPDLGFATMSGTADLMGIKEEVAYILDWKFGRLPVEDARTNVQLAAYAAALLFEYPAVQLVHVAIVQPRLGFVDRAAIHRTDLNKIMLRIASIIARVRADIPANPVPGACLYCGQKAQCPALTQHALQVGSALGLPSTYDPVAVSRPEDMARMQTLAKLLTEWCEQVRTENLHRALSGVEIPGYQLVSRKGTPSVMDPSTASDLLVTSGLLRQPADLLTCCRVSLPDLVSYIAAGKGGDKATVREHVEHVLTDVLKYGEPIQFLQATKKKKEVSHG